MSKLLIVESPAKAKTISKYLDNKYTVRASVGHVRDLPKSNKKAVDIEGGFVPHYEITEAKKSVVRELKKLAKGADEIVLATDPDREGEAIAWHLMKALDIDGKAKRIVFHEITEDAVKEAIKSPRGIDENLRRAQEARRVLDRLVGYDLSGLIWKKVRYGLSAGRVQSPALRILVEREREIRAFKPETFWTIEAEVKSKDDVQFAIKCAEEPREKARVDEIVSLGKSGKWSVLDVKESEVKRATKPPFTTSTLQQAASSRLGMSPSRTMSAAQRLYEAGHITYMRTDSMSIAAGARSQILSHVEKKFGAKYAKSNVYKTKSKSAQEAHEAVRPTRIEKESAGTTDEQKKLYRLIHARTLASQMADAKLLRAKIIASTEDKKVPDFTVNGSRVMFPGWLAADTAARGEDVELPKVSAGDALKLMEILPEEKQTLPPPRYSEAGLVKELEKRGIGRPSTYASIIRTLLDRHYVEKDGRALKPTDTGDVVSTFLEENFTNYISDSFTAEMENELDEIARGERTYKKTLEDFYGPFTKSVKEKESIEKLTNLGDAPPEHKCPKCDESMVIKLGKSGKFLSCSKFPDCDGARSIDGEEMEGPKKTGEKCPDCGEELVERDGRYGRFVSCSNYPKCKFVKRDLSANSTGVKCTECAKKGLPADKQGEMGERRGRYGVFYSCSCYPDCKHAIKAKPTGKICKECGSLEMEGTKTIPERCSNKECLQHNPHKLK